MSVLVEFSMTPIDKGPSLGQYIARSLDIVDTSGVDYRLNTMGTILEGDWNECMGLIGRCFERMSADCERITCSIKIDHRRGVDGRIESKIASVERSLGRTMKH